MRGNKWYDGHARWWFRHSKGVSIVNQVKPSGRAKTTLFWDINQPFGACERTHSEKDRKVHAHLHGEQRKFKGGHINHSIWRPIIDAFAWLRSKIEASFLGSRRLWCWLE